jgi:hypothetical protein
VSTREYKSLAGATRITAKRDFEDLVRKNVLVPGGKGRGAFYLYSKKRLINGSNGSLKNREEKILHNHPSGDPAPSREDRDCTNRLASAANIIGIRVLDHIVFGESDYYSFADAGQMGGPNEIG